MQLKLLYAFLPLVFGSALSNKRRQKCISTAINRESSSHKLWVLLWVLHREWWRKGGFYHPTPRGSVVSHPFLLVVRKLCFGWVSTSSAGLPSKSYLPQAFPGAIWIPVLVNSSQGPPNSSGRGGWRKNLAQEGYSGQEGTQQGRPCNILLNCCSGDQAIPTPCPLHPPLLT